jgi:hypothetical protein
MTQSRTRFVGMAVHQETMAVASGAQEPGADVTSLGTMGTRQGAMAHRLRTRPSQAQPLLCLSEAGPWGAWRSRSRQKQDEDGGVVAPSLRPTQAGERVTTDRRDARQLARLARAGALTPVSVPTGDEEAIRERTRARAETRSARKDATFRLQACVLRQEMRSAGRAHGGPAPLRGRAAVVGPTPAPPIVLHAEVRAVTDHTERLGRLDQARRAQVTTWRCPPVVDALQALRGVPCTVAVTLVAAMGDLTRCEPPSARMPCLGCGPSA